jgi:formate dehydrogenase beta subunit
MLKAVLDAVLTMGILGGIIGVVLAAASKIFYVFVDPKVMAVDDALPGANCGGCGLPGCTANAEAIVAGKAAPNSCVAGGPDLGDIIAALLGVSVEAKEPDIARPGCTYGVQDADLKYTYEGVNDCRAAAMLGGGMKVCTIGCLGLGTCAAACPFDAIVMGEDNLPKVIEARCTGCGTCERVCPKHIITLSSITRRIIREYTVEDCTTPCQRTCPAGIDIREYIHQVAIGDYHRAVQVIKERNPFPAVIGRICPRPCENDCRRKYIDEPVAINAIKRFVADYENTQESRILPFKAPDTGRKIAVVGGGVEGLSAAFFSARLGHTPTVFEATENPGGLLRSAIARNRLPLDILDKDIQAIQELGVEIRTNQMLGQNISVNALLQDGFEAVFTASGGWDNRLARGAGDAMENPTPGIYLLINLLKATDDQLESMDCRGNAVIVGGGTAAVKAAQILKTRGAKTITLLDRRPEASTELTDGDRETLVKIDATVIHDTDLTQLRGNGDDLVEVVYEDISNSLATTVPANMLVVAAGRFPEFIFTPFVPEAADDAAETPGYDGAWTAVQPYKRPEFHKETGLLSTGNPITDISAAIKAIAAGRRGAASIHQAIYGLDISIPDTVITPEVTLQNVDTVTGVKNGTRSLMPLCSPSEASAGSELELGFNEAVAKKEAARCLQCGLICYQRSETGIAPASIMAEPAPTAVAVRAASPGGDPVFSLDDHNRIH